MHHSKFGMPMSQLGQTRLFDDVDAMSAAPLIATQCCTAVSGVSGENLPRAPRKRRGPSRANAVLKAADASVEP